MFNFKRQKTVNLLTHLFDGGREPELEEVLLNSDLSISVRYEVPELIEYIFPPNTKNSKTFDNILDLCIPLSTQELTYKSTDIRLQRNASNILSTICGALQKSISEDGRLETRLKNFIMKNNKYAQDRTFSGHFSRIAETYIRYTKGEFFKQNGNFFNDLLKLINILSYKNLVVSIVAEFYPTINEGLSNNETVFEKIALAIARGINEPDGWLTTYNLFSTIILALQQQDPVFVNNLDKYDVFTYLFKGAMESADNTVAVFESFRCIYYIENGLKNMANYEKAKKKIINKYQDFFSPKSKVSIGKKYAAFKFFGESALSDMIVYFFKDSNSFFCNSVIEFLSSIPGEKRLELFVKLNICKLVTDFWKENEKLERNFRVIKLVLVFAAEFKKEEADLYQLLKDEEYKSYKSDKWREIVFEAKKIMTNAIKCIESSKAGDFNSVIKI